MPDVVCNSRWWWWWWLLLCESGTRRVRSDTRLGTVLRDMAGHWGTDGARSSLRTKPVSHPCLISRKLASHHRYPTILKGCFSLISLSLSRVFGGVSASPPNLVVARVTLRAFSRWYEVTVNSSGCFMKLLLPLLDVTGIGRFRTEL